ncbi:hypothetical protein Sgleb_11520 [Streptomyces glebosus]|uniref:Uncharacterized protein n=1 Tax=Streptomyces glebosus TaxID=249580 RepID=A0A640SUA6_9ACTN|nr:hypothetical protein Sgleb_11520 [Streptomyces glebosus]GHG78251.1 hypothetical protein GCM10010513_54470 [Streptomyces glebosus]
MATQHTYRVIVRGTWDGLTAESRTKLLAEGDAQGLDRFTFTPEGSLAYDTPLRRPVR